MYDVVKVFGFLLVELGNVVYVFGKLFIFENMLIGIFYLLIWLKYKVRVLKLFRENEVYVCVVVVTFVLSMGVNFLDV